jgi:hypothetical protein
VSSRPWFIDSQAFVTGLAESLTLIMHAKITHALRVPHACWRSRPSASVPGSRTRTLRGETAANATASDQRPRSTTQGPTA